LGAGDPAGVALHHQRASGSTRSHPSGLPSGGGAAVRGQVRAGGPEAFGRGPEAGVRDGEPGDALKALEGLKANRDSRYPGVVSVGWEEPGVFLRLYGYLRLCGLI